MRKFTDFIIWNHVFFMMEIVYALYISEYILAILGTLTTYLSIERHRFMDVKYNNIEPIVAKSTLLYTTVMGLYYLSIQKKILLLLSEMITVFVYYIQRYDYETIHPWLHITVASNIYIYIYYNDYNDYIDYID